MAIITSEYLKEKIDEYAQALRRNSENVPMLRQEALRNIAKYVEEYNLGKKSTREFDLEYSERANYMMRTYVRVFGELTRQIEVNEPVQMLYRDVKDVSPHQVSFRFIINELIRNDLPDKITRTYHQDRAANKSYDKCSIAYKTYLHKRGIVEEKNHPQEEKGTVSPKFDIDALLREDLSAPKNSLFSKLKKRISGVSQAWAKRHKLKEGKKRAESRQNAINMRERDAVLYEQQLQQIKDEEAKRQARQQQKEAKRQARQQQKEAKAKSNNQQPAPKRSHAKAFMLTALIGLAGAAGVFGIGKLVKDGSNRNKSDNVKIAKVDSVRNDTPKDTISAILANKQAYQQEQMDKAATQSTVAAVTPRKAVKTSTAKFKPNKQSAPKDKKISLSRTESKIPQASVDTLSTARVDTLATLSPDTISLAKADTLAPDTISLAKADTLAPISDTLHIIADSLNGVGDSVLTGTDSIMTADSLSLSVDSISVTNDTLVAPTTLTDTVSAAVDHLFVPANDAVAPSDSSNIVQPDNSIYNTKDKDNDSISTNNNIEIKSQTNTDTNAISDTLQSYHAMTPQQSKHIHDCDSMLTVVCGSSERRDSLYQQMIAFIDSGNFVPPSETHLSDITMNIVYMSVCSNPNMRKIGEAILDGQKITPEQQKIVNTIKPWNKSVVRVVGGLGIRGLYFAPAPSDKNTHLGSDGNVNGKTQSLCGKGYKTQSQNRVIEKLLESGRLKASSH